MPRISDEFIQRIIRVYGEAGADWLGRISGIVAECKKRWSLSVMPPFASLSFNYLAPAVRADGTGLVLKLGVTTPDLIKEMTTLRLYGGHGMVRLLEGNESLGAILLERLKPGSSLSSVTDDQQAVSIAAQVMRNLRRPPPQEDGLPSVQDWAMGLEDLRRRFGRGSGPFSAPLVARAENLFPQLLATMGEPVVLHGDLHQQNILSAEREPWLAIDPKGLIGEAEYEVGAFLRNNLLSQPQPDKLLARRLDQFADELGFQRDRLLGWGLAQAVLSAWWSFEDHGQIWDEPMICAELLSEL